MNDTKALWENLRTQRDELRLQMKLAGYELREEWQVIEKQLNLAQDQFEDLLEDAEDTAEDIQKVLTIVAQEIGSAYSRIRERVREDRRRVDRGD